MKVNLQIKYLAAKSHAHKMKRISPYAVFFKENVAFVKYHQDYSKYHQDYTHKESQHRKMPITK